MSVGAALFLNCMCFRQLCFSSSALTGSDCGHPVGLTDFDAPVCAADRNWQGALVHLSSVDKTRAVV